MMNFFTRRLPSPAMVVASIALTVALSGASYAAVVLPRDSVGTPQLKRDAVVSSKVKNGSLQAVDFAQGQLPAGPQGPQGPAGPAGPKGATGPQGPAGPGVAAYGFVRADGSSPSAKVSSTWDASEDHYVITIQGVVFPRIAVVTPATSSPVIATANAVPAGTKVGEWYYLSGALIVDLTDLKGNPVQGDFQFAIY